MKRRLHPLAIVRIAVSTLFTTMFAAAFLGLGGAAPARAIASLQLFPGAIRLIGTGAATVFLVTLGVSTLFGRVYCSTFCPLGAMQDATAALGRKRSGAPYSYARGRPLLKAAVFAAAAAALTLGAGSYAAFVDPYSLSGRFFQYAARPAARALASLAAWLARAAGSRWRIGDEPIVAAAALAATVPIVLVLAAAALRGRPFCNTLCPVGAVLGALNRVAPLRVRLDAGKCTSCGACARVCKARCIDAEHKALDEDRCVSCFTCLSACPTGALSYGAGKPTGRRAPRGPIDTSRRSFLAKAAAGGAATAIALVLRPISSSAEAAIGPIAPLAPAAPPGAGSMERFLSTCVGCGLCAASCPSRVIQPSISRYGLRGLFAPFLDYDVSYCQYECSACLDACPTGALRGMGLPDKKLVQMGTAALVREKCIVITDKTACGACAEHCPTGAVRMRASPSGIPEPVFDEAICIGCGACHHICPAEPIKAITVTGKSIQGTASAPTKNLFSANGPDSAVGSGTAPDDFPF